MQQQNSVPTKCIQFKLGDILKMHFVKQTLRQLEKECNLSLCESPCTDGLPMHEAEFRILNSADSHSGSVMLDCFHFNPSYSI